MITVPAHRVKQFGVEFFQASFSAKDIDRLVKFEVLGYGGGEVQPATKAKQRANRARVNWEALEKRIGESEVAYQRPVIRRKIDELVNYYRDCKDAGTLPAIPGAVIITSEKRFTFTPMASQHDLGLLQIPEEHGVLRVNWEALEKRIGESEVAYQRPVIRRKIDELVNYYRDCKDAGTLPAIPGAVIITSEKRFTFTPMASQHDLGLLQIPEEHGVLR